MENPPLLPGRLGHPRRAVVATLAALLTAMLVVAGMPATAGAASLTVTGRLLDDAGVPLAGMNVQAVPAAGASSLGTTTAVTTDGEGRFSLPMPRAGKRFLLKAWDGNGSSVEGASECVEPAKVRVLDTYVGSRGAQTFLDLDPITGYKARSGSSIDTGAHRLAATSGFDIDVTPALGTTNVRVLRADGGSAYDGLDCGALDHGFVPGRYTLVFTANGYETKRIATTLERGEVESHSVTLAPEGAAASAQANGGSVRGRFVTPGSTTTGKVTLVNGAGTVVDSEKLSAREVFVLDAPAGTYRLVYVDAKRDRFSYSSVRISAGKVTQLGNVNATRKTVLLYGKVPSGVQVDVRTTSGKVVRTDANAKGRYYLRDLVPGTYRVTFQRPGYLEKTVKVKVRKKTRLDVPRMTRSGAVTGTIVYGANGLRVPDDAMVGAVLTSKRTGVVAQRDPEDHDASLVLRHEGVTAGRYAVVLSSPEKDLVCYDEDWDADECFPYTGVNSFRQPYYWSGKKIVRVGAGSNDVGTIKVGLLGGL